jgi:hypothetical protein
MLVNSYIPLIELNPYWINDGDRKGIALGFNCPCGCKRIVKLFLSNPLDMGDKFNCSTWMRDGDKFGSLSLTPYIDSCSGTCHWRGRIKNGGVSFHSIQDKRIPERDRSTQS